MLFLKQMAFPPVSSPILLSFSSVQLLSLDIEALENVIFVPM